MKNRIDILLDKSSISQLLQDWALWRDVGNWEALRGAYSPGATMRTTWFDGPAADFVEASMRMSQGKTKAQHFVGASSIDVSGTRALAETRVILLVRSMLHEVEVDATCYGRFFDRLVQTDGRWYIASRVPIYEKDYLRAVNPSAQLELNADELARYPMPYRYLAYLQASGGATITLDLPLPGSVEQATLHEQGRAWLSGADA